AVWDSPFRVGGIDHRETDAVLVRPTRIHELELCEQRRARLAAEVDEPDERRRADEVEDGRVGARHCRGQRNAGWGNLWFAHQPPPLREISPSGGRDA